jgi:hypothetical protein
MKKLIDSVDTALQGSAIALLISAGLFVSAASISHGLSLIASDSAQNPHKTHNSDVNWEKSREFSIGGIFVCGGGFLACAISRAIISINEE